MRVNKFAAVMSSVQLCPEMHVIGHFLVPLGLSFKASLSAKFLLW